jgi:hypothetical protein
MKNPDQSAMENQIELLLGNAGILSQHLPAFRFRSQQKLLAENIAAALADDGFLLAEAGTGIGKTFAYLIPAITWCQQTKNKVVVSTRTKALQQQITEDDLPALLRIMNSRIKTAEAKGRDNYLCWNKYQQILAGKKALSAAEQDFVQAILVWRERTKSGDRKELELPSEMMQSWPVLAADRTSCLRDQCRYQDKCFRQKMIRNVHKADLIIVNHALLLSDILIENRKKASCLITNTSLSTKPIPLSRNPLSNFLIASAVMKTKECWAHCTKKPGGKFAAATCCISCPPIPTCLLSLPKPPPMLTRVSDGLMSFSIL